MSGRRLVLCGVALAAVSAAGCGRLFGRARPEAKPEEPPGPSPTRLLPLGRDDGIKAAATIRGKVIVAKKLYGVVAINVGETHGVRPRYAFNVYRGERFIGIIVVDDTFDDMSSAHYGKTMKGHVEAGDEVTTKLAAEP
ncbi:MAG: hypothetical protein FJ291_02775 [Planctomycetes bacterium]|nr:hypothetical protein [Planctomycetota bacterium]